MIKIYGVRAGLYIVLFFRLVTKVTTIITRRGRLY